MLTGLSSLVRTGDVIAVYENDSVTLEAHLGESVVSRKCSRLIVCTCCPGFENLTGSYEWSATLMGGGPGGSSVLHVGNVKVIIWSTFWDIC